MFISVAICTWNRCELLQRTLSQMVRLRVPDDCEWEMLVVNNNSTDDTERVVGQFEGLLPLRRLNETQQGQCFARNRAVAEARGDLLIWTDDDVIVDENWLSEYAKAVQLYPDAHFFGGTIEPWFEESPPDWVVNNMDGMRAPLVINRLGEEIRELRTHEYPLGANMAFWTRVIRSYPFDVTIGHRGGRLCGGDDIDVIDRMRADGLLGVWVGTAKVQHFIPKDRMSKEYLTRQAVDYGSSHAQQLFYPAKRRMPPAWCVRQWIESNCAWLWCRVTQKQQWVSQFMKVQHWNAFMAEWWGLTLNCHAKCGPMSVLAP
jgi:glucosyl-dolichyl phosphate glucuronosyltransferase